MSRPALFATPGGLRRVRPKQRPVLPALPDGTTLRARLLQHTRREWIVTPIQAPAPCWANSALGVYLDLFHGADGY